MRRGRKALEKSAALATKPGYPPIGDCKRACAKLRKAAGLWESLSHAGDRTAIALLDALPENCGMTFEKRPPGGRPAAPAPLCSHQPQHSGVPSPPPSPRTSCPTSPPNVRRRRRERGGAQRVRDGAPKHHARSTRGGQFGTLTRACSGACAPTSARAGQAREEHGVCGLVPRRRGAIGAGDRLHLGRGRRPARDLDALKKALQVGARPRTTRTPGFTTRRCPRPRGESTACSEDHGPRGALCLIG